MAPEECEIMKIDVENWNPETWQEILNISKPLVEFLEKDSYFDVKFNNTDDFDIFDVLSDEMLSVENQIIKSQILEDVRNLIEELPDDQKEVLLMRMYRDMSFKEISEATGVSINTALGRMRYGLINLRKMMNERGMSL